MANLCILQKIKVYGQLRLLTDNYAAAVSLIPKLFISRFCDSHISVKITLINLFFFFLIGCLNSMIFVFRFPLNNQELLSRWLEQMRRTFWYPESTSHICSRHFTPDCFRQYLSGQYRLKEDAVPTIWNLPSNLARVSYLNKFHHNIY